MCLLPIFVTIFVKMEIFVTILLPFYPKNGRNMVYIGLAKLTKIQKMCKSIVW